ncbi:MAG: hypothetical protein JO010_01900 [Alphaproteobacteria bacterium]|nr:hypothetical protein [Alphaproteobacteria bacterium]
MRFDAKTPPRTFIVGNAAPIAMQDCGTLHLAPDEQVTLVTESGAEYDVARKEWGFYATPSLNGRLEGFGLRAVLIQNRGTMRYFVLLVERGKEEAFARYLDAENLRIVHWLDSSEACAALDRKLAQG